MINDVILCLSLKLPECTACSLSNNGIWLLVYWQSILHLSGFCFISSVRISKFSSEFCIKNILVWNEDDDILTDIAQCIPGVTVTRIE